MARPRVFVGSTFYDLQEIRDRLSEFIESLGFDAVVAERGHIPYEPDKAPAETCPKEAATCDIFVLIIGGRYGSPAPGGPCDRATKGRRSDYRSVTMTEYDAALAAGAAIYAMVQADVDAEYGTYRVNRTSAESPSRTWAHVDDERVFHFLDTVRAQPTNIVQRYSGFEEMRDWLCEQWAGLFRTYLHERRERPVLESIQAQLAKLTIVSDTLQTLSERIVIKIDPREGDRAVRDARDTQAVSFERFIAQHRVTQSLARMIGRPVANVVDAARRSDSLSNFVAQLGGRATWFTGRAAYAFPSPVVGIEECLVLGTGLEAFYAALVSLMDGYTPSSG